LLGDLVGLVATDEASVDEELREGSLPLTSPATTAFSAITIRRKSLVHFTNTHIASCHICIKIKEKHVSFKTRKPVLEVTSLTKIPPLNPIALVILLKKALERGNMGGSPSTHVPTF